MHTLDLKCGPDISFEGHMSSVVAIWAGEQL